MQISTRGAMDGVAFEDLGKKTYDDCIKERINSCTKEIYDLVKKSKLPLFSTLYSGRQPSIDFGSGHAFMHSLDATKLRSLPIVNRKVHVAHGIILMVSRRLS